MKKIMLAVSALVLGTVAASAADMAVKARPAPAPLVVYNWTGCYIGGNVGGGWARTGQDQIGKVDGTVFVPPGNFGSSEGSDFIGGVQIGCDYQFAGNWVLGVQGMFDFGNIDSEHTLPAFPAFYSANSTKNVFTLTGRLGYLFAPQVLAYVKGGGAWARIDHSVYGFGPPAFLSESAGGVDRSGWTVGGGLEWMFAPGWSVFGEYNYMDFGHNDVRFVQAPGTVGVADVVRTHLEVQQVLVGVNYKFNFGGPVVAKY
ncbi:outer membrane beta-barrel protein [Bradyrhizobium sediminis]|uniref:Outer membrane beta-barrel protein n=1 Tax=Bradyrhizobium sediminis TaxID=2840469 RepID=A0A975RVU0_9BRAD|nr:outer membrane beta-barrel protein [Bradyrhizobium sediminis]QWG21403.1 outer membrane beta-barrel protein [Bradyrhizobium sediminis]